MKPFTILILFTLMGINISSCSALREIEKRRIEKEQQELVQMKGYNAGLVSFFEKDMKPLLKDKGQLAKSDSFDPNKPELNLRERYMEISWQNRVSLLLNGRVYLPNLDKRKVMSVKSMLISKYRNYIEKKGGTIKEGKREQGQQIIGTGIPYEDCGYDAPLFGYVNNNLDSVLLPFVCKVESGYGGTRGGRKQSIKTTHVYFRVVDGAKVERKLSGFSSFSAVRSSKSALTSSNSRIPASVYSPITTPTLDESTSRLHDSWDDLKNSLVDLLLHPTD